MTLSNPRMHNRKYPEIKSSNASNSNRDFKCRYCSTYFVEKYDLKLTR